MKMKYAIMIITLILSNYSIAETVRAYLQGSTFIVSATNNSDTALNCNETHTLNYVQFDQPGTYSGSSNFTIPGKANNMNVVVHQTTWAASTLKIGDFNYQCN